MLVKVIGNDRPVRHYLVIGSIAYVEHARDAVDVLGSWVERPSRLIPQTVSKQDCRHIPHNKANLRAFAKQQKHFYKKAK